MSKPFMVVSDTQAPFHDLGCVAIVLEYIRQQKPAHLLLNGDILDCFTISSYDRGANAGYRQLKTEWEVSDREVVEPIYRAATEANEDVKITFIEGNHEFRLQRLYGKLQRADLMALFDFIPSIQSFFKLKERGIKYVASKAGNGIFDFTPHLKVMHGSLGGVNPAKAHYDKFHCNLIHGHTHRAMTWAFKSAAGAEHVAMAAGCLCKEPDWLDFDQWTRGFIVGEIDEDGTFSADHEKILITGKHRRELRSRVYGHFIATENNRGVWAVELVPPGASGGNKDRNNSKKKR